MERVALLGRHFDNNKLQQAPVKVTITGASGKIGYSLVFMIGQGRMFGPDQPVELQLLELPEAKKNLLGDLMELKDSALPLLKSLKGTTSEEEAFEDCQVAILVGAKPRGPGMERKDLLIQNALIFKRQGEVLNKVAYKNCKIVVVGNPANTNALICSKYAPNIPKENFTCLTRLDHNRAIYQLSAKVKTTVDKVRNVCIWGNHSLTQFPDTSYAVLIDYPQKGFVVGVINDKEWIENKFVKKVAKRGGEIIQVKNLSSSASAANSICDHIHDWLIGTKNGELVSMGVISDNNPYNIPANLCFSFPLICDKGNWEIVKGYKFDEFGKNKIQETINELIEERDSVFSYLNSI